ncbi:hypothetical protein AWB74_07916 [Caballeronia arvi]|uniref:DUF4280 domain-containing protein n=1 Tax=Caballeronia arvi TaxID=1777135 RepID=A0A158L0P7_9BURK|nr:DUF4280 domain-containing protein [Caballeronia arvi]SAL86968.1 hypothetical protein AWB74_07916 [Caballeronia arvi]
MAQNVYSGATLQCSFGVTSSKLVVPIFSARGEGPPAANVTDFGPENVTTFGMCSSASNPVVATATAASEGVLTPMPCTPVLMPWSADGALRTLVRGKPALDEESQCCCAYGGMVKILDPAKPEAQVQQQPSPFLTRPRPEY